MPLGEHIGKTNAAHIRGSVAREDTFDVKSGPLQRLGVVEIVGLACYSIDVTTQDVCEFAFLLSQGG